MIIMKYPFHPFRWLLFLLVMIDAVLLLSVLLIVKFYYTIIETNNKIGASGWGWLLGGIVFGGLALSLFWSEADRLFLLNGGDVHCPKCSRKGFIRRLDRFFVCGGCGFKMVVEGYDKLNPKPGQEEIVEEDDPGKNVIIDSMLTVFFPLYAYLIGFIYRFGGSDSVFLRGAWPEEDLAAAQNGNISVNPFHLRRLGRNIEAHFFAMIIAASIVICYFSARATLYLSEGFSSWARFAFSVLGSELSMVLLYFFYRWVAKSPGKYWVELTPDGQEISNEGGRI